MDRSSQTGKQAGRHQRHHGLDRGCTCTRPDGDTHVQGAATCSVLGASVSLGIHICMFEYSLPPTTTSCQAGFRFGIWWPEIGTAGVSAAAAQAVCLQAWHRAPVTS